VAERSASTLSASIMTQSPLVQLSIPQFFPAVATLLGLMGILLAHPLMVSLSDGRAQLLWIWGIVVVSIVATLWSVWKIRQLLQALRQLQSKIANLKSVGDLAWLAHAQEAAVTAEPEQILVQVQQTLGALADRCQALERLVSQLQQAEQDLQHNEAKYRELVENANGIILKVDREGNITFFNRYAQSFFGYSEAEILGRSVIGTIVPEVESTGRDMRAALRLVFSRPEKFLHHENENLCKDGRSVWVSWTNKPLRDETGALVGILCIGNDVTDRKRTQQELQRAEALYRGIFENAIEGIYRITTDPQGRFLSANPALAKILGYESPAQLMTEVLSIRDQIYVQPQQRDLFMRLMAEQGTVTRFESQVYRRDGRCIWISENARVVNNGTGQPDCYEGLVEDITDRKWAEEQLRHYALHDSLTGLPNRALFIDRLDQAIQQSHQQPDFHFAVLFLDLDRFKVANDSLGHFAGDQLLIEMSFRLSRCLNSGDIVARLGSDEFAILLDDLPDPSHINQVVEKVFQTLQQPFQVSDQDIFLTTSIGIVTNNHRYELAEEVLRDASLALHQAKQSGKACQVTFDTDMRAKAMALLHMEINLRRVIQRQELAVSYQPIVQLATGKTIGFEALVRWHCPGQGWLAPSDFLPIAEEMGLLTEIDCWVLEQACNDLCQWQTNGAWQPSLKAPPLQVNVNLCGQQFSSSALSEHVADILNRTGIAGHHLKLEITESVIMASSETVIATLTELKTLGIKLCIDDFGTGYSSLSRLHRLPINTLKIDRSFVSGLGQAQENWRIIETIIRLAHSLGLDVVAEGIETPAQLKYLQQQGCQYGQGFLLGKGMDREQAQSWLRDHAVISVCSSTSIDSGYELGAV